MFLTRRFYIAVTAVIIVIAGGYLWLPLFDIGRWLLFALLLLLTVDLGLLYWPWKTKNANFSTENDDFEQNSTKKSGKIPLLSATRQCADRFSNGDENPVTIDIENHYPIPVSLEIIDEIPAELANQKNKNHKLSTLNSQLSTVNSQLIPTRRGTYSFGQIRLFAQTKIGLAERRFTSGSEQDVKVYPSFAKLSQYEFLAIHNNLTEQGIKRIRRVGHQTEFEQIKDYVTGDDYRTINWRATAHRHQLMVNVYNQEHSQQIYSLIDKGRVMQQAFRGMTLLDYAINASLALSFVAIRKEDRAGLITFAGQIDSFLPAKRQQGQMHTLMELLYAQQTDFAETDYSALCVCVNKYISKRSLLVLYTNFSTLVSLRRQLPYLQQLNRRHRLLVVFFEDTELAVRPESPFHEVIAEKFAYEKRLIVSLLKQHGIAALLTPPEKLSVNVINKYLELKQQNL